MTIPKWLLPVLSIVAALAVGVAATLLGMRFASADVQSSPSKTSTAPLYAPVTGSGLSPAVGTQTGTLPGSSPTPMTGARQQLINDVLHSPDPAATIREETTGGSAGSGGESGSAPAPAPAADPCSPSSGEPPAGCPAGVHGAIYASHMIPPFWLNAIAFPHATSTSSSTPRCPATTAAGQVTIGTASSVPADFTITYWPTATPANRQTATFQSDRAQIPAFNAYYSGTATGVSPTEYGCKVLTVDAGTAYTAQVGGVDDLDRVVSPVTVLFNGGGQPTLHPQLEAYTVGGNLLFASALHSADEIVRIKAITRTAGAANCDAPEAFPVHGSSGDSEVPASQLNDHRILPADNQRWTDDFVVPEGTDFVLCARWYSNSHAVWGRTAPSYESRQTISSPDMLEPTVTMTAIDPDPSVETVTAQFNSAAGILCGPLVVWHKSAGHSGGLTLPVTVCDSSLYGGGEGHYWDMVDDGIMHFQFRVDFSSDLSSQSRPDGYFPLARHCVGECAIPAPAEYRLPLFDNTNRAANGAVTLRISYRQGNHNGAADWVMGSAQGLSTGLAPAGPPSFDTSAVTVAGPIDYGRVSSSAIIHITSDRSVDYSVTARENDGASGNCLRSGTGTVTGHLDAPGDVTVDGLCLGTGYDLEVTLTDAHGLRSIWGVRGADPNGWWPVGSVVVTPALAGTIRFDFRPFGSGQSEIGDVTMSLGTATLIDGHSALEQACRPDGLFNLQTSVPNVHLGQQLTLRLGYDTQASDSGNPGCHPQSGAPLHAAMAEIPVQLTQLYGTTDGLLITHPGDADGDWTLHLWFDAAPHS